MKRNARKDASQERQSIIGTGGGPPAPPVQQETEWFRTVMPVSMDGLPSVVNDDFIENQPTVTILKKKSPEVIDLDPKETCKVQADEHKENLNPSENIIYTVSDADMLTNNVFDSKSSAALLRTPVPKPLRIHKRSQNYSETKSSEDIKCEILEKTRDIEEHLHKLKIKHMEEKRQEERELYELQKRKIILEISLLEN